MRGPEKLLFQFPHEDCYPRNQGYLDDVPMNTMCRGICMRVPERQESMLARAQQALARIAHDSPEFLQYDWRRSFQGSTTDRKAPYARE